MGSEVRGQRKGQCWARVSHLEVRNRSSGLQEQVVLVHAQPALHHLLVVQLEGDAAARRDVDLRGEGLQFLGVGPYDPCRLVPGAGLGVQPPGQRLLLHRAHERDAVHVPAEGEEEEVGLPSASWRRTLRRSHMVKLEMNARLGI